MKSYKDCIKENIIRPIKSMDDESKPLIELVKLKIELTINHLITELKKTEC